MRKRSSFMGVLAVGALAVGVSVYAAPRAVGTVPGKSDARQLVTGTSETIQRAVDGGIAGGAPYVGIVNDYSLDGSNARLFFEIILGGWGGVLDTYQISVDQATFASGSGAALIKPSEACGVDADCVGLYGPGSKCTGGICDVGYQDAANPRFAVNGISAVSQINLAFGSTKLPGFAGETDDGGQWYAGDLVLDAIGARGTYNLEILASAATFLVLNTGEITIATYFGAVVDVPLGKCCVVSDGSCTDDTTLSECNDLGGLHFPGSPCSAGCIECVNDGDCDDGDACTDESCNTTLGVCNRSAAFNEATQCCNGSTAAITTKDDGDDCTDDFCDGAGACSDAGRDPGTCGAAAHSPSAADTVCDDGNTCTVGDVCDGAGLCGGTDANTFTCVTDDDCLAATGSALECQNGFCFCTLSPPLTWNITPSDAVDPNCFDDGEKVLATAHVGPSLDVITGGEVAFTYDPACMQYNGIITVAPFNNILFIDDSVPGAIFVAVGIDLGGVGVGGGNFDLLAATFTKVGGCAACDLCFTDVNPRHTRLTSSVGQVVTVTPECSKEVRGDGELTLATPASEKVNAECSRTSAEVTWDAPSAADTCQLSDFWCGGLYQNSYTGEIADVTTIGIDPYAGGRFPIGDAVFCCNAANDCGETARECWTVTVNDQTSLDVDLALSPTMAVGAGEGLTRCIKFEVFSNCSTAPLVFSENVVFGGLFDLVGKVNTSIKIPSAGQFGCITARDQLHTLRSCYTFGAGDCDADGVLHATFKGDPFFGGNWLVGGNLDGYKKDSATASLNAIDITDFGMFVSQYPADLGTGDTPCGTDGPHADINGDGLVDMLDFTFITMNFLLDSKDCCCPGSAAASPSGRTEIPARGDMRQADINGDNVVNMTDISLFLEGYQAPKSRRTGLR